MANGFAAKDANGATVEIASSLVTVGAVAGQAQANQIVDPSNNNLLGIDSLGRVTVVLPLGVGQALLFGVINTASSGDNTLVAAQGASKVIYLVSYTIVVSGALTVTFKSNAGNNKSGGMAFGANGGASAVGQPSSPLLATNANEALLLNLSGAVQCSGHYSYFVA